MSDYGEFISDSQIWDLIKFIKETAHNTDDFYTITTTTGTYPTGTKSFSDLGNGGDSVHGKQVYDAKCKGCHGADGTQINIYCKTPALVLGNMFREDPHEIQHKSIWSMPDDIDHNEAGCTTATAMPAIDITDQDIRDMMVMDQDATAFPDGQ